MVIMLRLEFCFSCLIVYTQRSGGGFHTHGTVHPGDPNFQIPIDLRSVFSYGSKIKAVGTITVFFKITFFALLGHRRVHFLAIL